MNPTITIYKRQTSEPIEIPTKNNSEPHEKSTQKKRTFRRRRHTIAGYAMHMSDSESQASSPASACSSPNKEGEFSVGRSKKRTSTTTLCEERIAINDKGSKSSIFGSMDSSFSATSECHELMLPCEPVKGQFQQLDNGAVYQDTMQFSIDRMKIKFEELETELLKLIEQPNPLLETQLQIENYKEEQIGILENLINVLTNQIGNEEVTTHLTTHKDRSNSIDIFKQDLAYYNSKLKKIDKDLKKRKDRLSIWTTEPFYRESLSNTNAGNATTCDNQDEHKFGLLI